MSEDAYSRRTLGRRFGVCLWCFTASSRQRGRRLFGFSDLPVVGFGVQAESMSCFKAATPTDTRIVLNVLLAPTIDP